MAFYQDDELRKLGFFFVGKDVLVSDRAAFHNPGKISLGDRTRIDDFCLLSAGDGGIFIGRNVHIACMVTIIGKEKVIIGDYAGLSGRVSLYSSSDDFSGRAMTNPTVPDQFRRVRSSPIHVGRHCIIGAGSVVLPGVTIGDGASVGALSLVISDCDPFMSYRGNPAVAFHPRRSGFLKMAEHYETLLGESEAEMDPS